MGELVDALALFLFGLSGVSVKAARFLHNRKAMGRKSEDGRDDWIRTSDLLTPSQTRYPTPNGGRVSEIYAEWALPVWSLSFFLDFFPDFTYNVKQSVTTIGKTQQYLIEVLK